MSPYSLPRRFLHETFAHFRGCGRGRRECQVLLLSPWDAPETISGAVHSNHGADRDGFALDDRWLTQFWLSLARENLGIRIQVHTHPGPAFHSPTDDAFPIVHTPGFLSLVIPDFGLGPIGFDDAFLAEIQMDGRWCQVPIADGIVLT
jgi:hypothetical protein